MFSLEKPNQPGREEIIAIVTRGSQRAAAREPDWTVERWQAWAPDGPADGNWAAWLDGARDGSDAEAKPDVTFLPALLRRRLERSGRMALDVAGHVLAAGEAMPSVFASRHGPFHRTMELLEALARNEPISPTLFSLAVHNSVAGLFSIARSDHSAHTSVAAGAATLAAGFWEATGQLAAGEPAVLVVYVSEPPPAMYQAYIGAVEPLFALALVLRAAGEPAWQFAPAPTNGQTEEPEYALLRLLCGQERRAVLAPGWAITRAVADE